MSALLEMLNHLAAMWVAEGRGGALRQVRLDPAGVRLTLDLDTAWAKGEAVLRATIGEGEAGRLIVTVTLEQAPVVLNASLVPFRELLEQGRVLIELPLPAAV